MSERPQPLVSVVMIFQNEERFLGEAIGSVLGQTYPRIELLLVDDGSVDASVAVALHRTRAEACEARLLTHPGHRNRGMSASRNLGIGAARGELIAFLDGDDYWEPEHVEGEVELLGRHPDAHAVCGGAIRWRSWNRSRSDYWRGAPFEAETLVEPPGMLSAVLRDGGYTTPMCSLMVRTATLRAIGGADNKFRSLYEDQVLLAKLYLEAAVVISGARTSRYRQHLMSSTSLAARAGSYDPARPNRARYNYLRWLKNYLSQRSVYGELVTLVDEELRSYRGVNGLIVAARSWCVSYMPRWMRRLIKRAIVSRRG